MSQTSKWTYHYATDDFTCDACGYESAIIYTKCPDCGAIMEVLTPLLIGCGAIAVVGIPAIIFKIRFAGRKSPFVGNRKGKSELIADKET